ncbi:MAG TPA: VWA domain-containing protein [Bryobacteraceae bacterium]|jgi:VWFA-related protein
MALKLGKAGKFAGALALCALAGLALAQVKVVDPSAPAMPAAPRVMPGQLATTPNQPPSANDSAPDTELEITPAGEPIVIHVPNIVAPTLVFAPDGSIMNNLQPSQFHLYDNGREQDIHVDTEYQPISLVIAIEASYRDDAILKQIHKIGSMIEPLVIGDAGEAAVIAYDHRVRTLQDFTSDPQKIKDAIAKVSSGSSQAALKDAVDQAILMLHHKKGRRKIILAIGEARDQGSKARGRQTLIALQLENITYYHVDISQVARRLTEQAEPPRPDPIAPEARNLPMGANTPLRVEQATGWGNSVEFMPALKEIYTDTKAIFIKDPVKVFTRGTGGAQFDFVKQRGLEEAIAKIGTEIHSQYIISYAPKKETLLEGGYHEIKIGVEYPRAKVVTRPGYWLAAVN